MRDLAPIALFAYNRPWHLMQTINSLMQNKLASKSNLFIFSDAPKSQDDMKDILEVRELIKLVSGFKSVTVIEREVNYGLAKSITEGVSLLCRKFGSVIVLEDDLVVSNAFLDYMNQALNFYAKEEMVMQISGYMFPIKFGSHFPFTFFSRMTTSWGWATWDRAWGNFEEDSNKLFEEISRSKLRDEFDMNYNYFYMLERQVNYKINSWAIRWYASVFLRNGLCLHPSVSLVKNIGNDGSGTNSISTTIFDLQSIPLKIENYCFPIKISESRLGRDLLLNYYQSIYSSPLSKFLGKLTSIFNQIMGLKENR